VDLAGIDIVVHAIDREVLPPGQPEALGALARPVLQRQDAHAHEI
jgi:hypothetical protein